MTQSRGQPEGAFGESSVDDRIIRAALALIAQSGLGAVTMRNIAETARISHQTLYNHYSDIDSIVTEAIARHNRESITLVESSIRVAESPEDKIGQLARHAVSIGVHAHHAAGIAHGLSAAARATLSEYDEALEASIRKILEEGQKTGAFRPDLALDVDAPLLRHMLNGLAEQAAETPDKAAALATTGARTILAAIKES